MHRSYVYICSQFLCSSYYKYIQEDPVESPANEYLIDITVNRICRVIVIVLLGSLGGWSIIPDEAHYLTTKIWVAFIVIIINVFVHTSRSTVGFADFGFEGWFSQPL